MPVQRKVNDENDAESVLLTNEPMPVLISNSITMNHPHPHPSPYPPSTLRPQVGVVPQV